MIATIENLSPLPRTHWCTLTVPAADATGFAGECTFVTPQGRWRAVRGRAMGAWVAFHVRADLQGNDKVEGQLVAEPHPDAKPFAMHPWVGDDVLKLVPALGLQAGGHVSWSQMVDWRLVENNSAVQRWWIKAVVDGFILEWWADVWSDDPVMDVYGKVVWSDRRDSRWNTTVEGALLRSGEMLSLDFATRHGMISGAKDYRGDYITILGINLSFVDGSGLPISGAMLCFKDAPDLLTDAQVAEGIRNIEAAAMSRGPVLGIAEHDNGHWLAHRNVANVFPSALDAAERAAWNAFHNSLQVTAGWYAQRPIGCSQTPAQTGSQEDFGSTKGTLAIAQMSPRQIYRMRYAVQAELFRGVHHYEDNLPLNPARHPNWVTWSGVTHYALSVSPDRLGKEAPRSPATGWTGYDDQHRSQNNLAAYLMLQDDPLMHNHLEHQLTVDQRCYRRVFPNNGADSARGQGRPIHAWANFLAVTENQAWAVLMQAQATQSEHEMMRLGNGSKMRVLSWISPDGRVPVMVDGVLAPSVSLWEHSLALVGFSAAQKRMLNPAIERIMDYISTLLLDYALLKDFSGETLVTSIAWDDGHDVVGGFVRGNSALLLDNGSGVGLWIRAALRVACERMRGKHPRVLEVSSYLQRTIHEPDSNLGYAEWWAAVE